MWIALAACAAPRPVPSSSATAFVEAVYRAHDPTKPGVPPWDGARCRETFTVRLCELIEKDRREAGEEVGRLDGDVLYDAQDFGISNLAFAPGVEQGGRASVRVTFVNLGQQAEVLVWVERAAGGWRIDDLEYRHEQPPTTLTQILSAPR